MAEEKYYEKVSRILIFILVLNWLVAGAKIFAGLFSRCQSMTADGLHSLSDGASNIIGLIGIAISSRPVDDDHPYGHGKYETFFSLGIAALLFLVALSLAKNGIFRFFHPTTPDIDAVDFAIMIGTMTVNIWVMRYEYRKGKLFGSDMLVADSMHTKADIFTSISVIITLAAIKLGYPILDPIATVMIAVFIGFSGYEIIKNASKILCDSMIVDKRQVSDIVLTIDGVKACHKIRTRGRPDAVCVDLHVQVAPNMHIDKAHAISFTIENAIKKKIPAVTDVLVHIEPRSRPRRFRRE